VCSQPSNTRGDVERRAPFTCMRTLKEEAAPHRGDKLNWGGCRDHNVIHSEERAVVTDRKDVGIVG